MATILVVEDTASERQLLTHFLQESGYSVIDAANGQEALEKIKSQTPDAVVTDLVMPGMSGLELCRNLRKQTNLENLPIVACTSKDQELDRLWGMKQGINVYLTKPFNRDEMLRAIKSLVG
jgi:two-component system, chemotaxis family, response regulator PixH